MKALIEIVFMSARKSLDNKLNFCYELYGFDFMIDNKFKVWLIECNTNPCLDESSNLLKKLIPQMLRNLYFIFKVKCLN